MTRWLAAALAAGLALAGCERSPDPAAPLAVVASIYPLYEFTRRIAGPGVEVTALVPPGVEPHDWEPSPQDVSRIRKARALVYNGAGLEPWVDRLTRGDASIRTVLVRASEGLPLLPAEPETSGGRVGAAVDPHVWLDPVLAQAMVETIGTALASLDRSRAPTYADSARALRAELSALDRAFASGLADCARRDIVASHGAWAYLAKRYRLHVISVMGTAPESEPSPARLAAIARFARDKKVQYIFYEPLASARLAETLAREIGASTLVLDPIEGVTPERARAGAGYVGLMEENLKNLRLALDCR